MRILAKTALATVVMGILTLAVGKVVLVLTNPITGAELAIRLLV